MKIMIKRRQKQPPPQPTDLDKLIDALFDDVAKSTYDLMGDFSKRVREEE
ncbi:MAG: hypothetical protein JRN53_06190 [Nitrososphaerota archaeon]|nr:hypothetical protein [Nitrososphaerota archaeon]